MERKVYRYRYRSSSMNWVVFGGRSQPSNAHLYCLGLDEISIAQLPCSSILASNSRLSLGCKAVLLTQVRGDSHSSKKWCLSMLGTLCFLWIFCAKLLHVLFFLT